VAGLILGVDVGQRRDPAALAVVAGLDVVHLERLPLGTSYTRVAERVAAIAEGAGNIPVVIDATGVGRAVVDMLAGKGLEPVAVTLTGGGVVRVSGREVSLPRKALFQPLQAAVEAGRLGVAEGLAYSSELAQELLAARGSAFGVQSRGAGHHGDLMVAVSLCLWWQGLTLARPG
jgi:hypothetical protein